MRELVLELMGEYGNLAVFLFILVENLFPPIPSEVILTFDPLLNGRVHGGSSHSLRSREIPSG